MRALVMRAPGEYAVEDVPKPVCGENEVLVQVKTVAICGSDPVLLAGGSLSDGLPGSLPHIAGHEGAGVIVECGRNVRGFAVGDRVAAESHLGCGPVGMAMLMLCRAMGSRVIKVIITM